MRPAASAQARPESARALMKSGPADHESLVGSYRRVERRAVDPSAASPPVSSARPSANAVSVKWLLAPAISPALVQRPVGGSKSSALDTSLSGYSASAPPTTNTRPPLSATAV